MAPEAYPRAAHATAIARLLERYQRVLGLGDWDVRFDPAPPPDGDRGHVEAYAVKRMARIRIHPDASLEALPRLVVHELLHIWFGQLKALAQPLMGFTPQLVDDAYDVAWDRVEHQFIHALEGALTGDAHLEFGDDSPEWANPWRREWQERRREQEAPGFCSWLRSAPSTRPAPTPSASLGGTGERH